MGLKPYFQLVRLPNVFTAAADSLAGWLLVRGSFAEPGRWLPLLGTSMAIYAGGIVLNDFMDYDVDRAERPSRPLPSGRVSRRTAAALAAVLLVGGVGVSGLTGSLVSFAVAMVLCASVGLYDLWAKRTWLGPEVMGACRGLNVLLGMSQAQAFGGPPAWLVAGSLAVFVIGVTWISRSETVAGQCRGVAAGWVLQDLAILGLFSAALLGSRFPVVPSTPSAHPSLPLAGLLVLLLVSAVVNARTGAAVRTPIPMRIQTAVKTGVLALVWLNVGVVAAVRGTGPALAVAALWVPAFVLGRWLYST
jgi:4-hydroxybenzoate polyprenyltransferase